MNSHFLFAFFLATFTISCGQKQEQDHSTLSTASASAPGRFAIVKGCNGVMNENWLGTDKKTPVLGELDISVVTKPGTKTITGISFRHLIPGRFNKVSNEYNHSGLFEAKSAAIESLNVSSARGSSVIFMKSAPNQTVSLTTEGQTEIGNLVSLEFRNGDGADYVHMKINLLNPANGQTFSGSFSFEGCGLENISLLRANSK